MVTTPEIEVRHLPGQTVAHRAYRGTLPSIEAETSAVRSWAVTMGYTPQGPLAIEVYGEPGDDPAAEYDIEIQLPVPDDARAAPSDRFQIKRFEPTDAAVMTLRGPHDLARLGEPLARMRNWLRGQNVEPTATVRWVEVTDPAKTTPDEQVTELQHLLRGGTPGSTSSAPAGAPTTPATTDMPAESASPQPAEFVPAAQPETDARPSPTSSGTRMTAPAAGSAPIPRETQHMADDGSGRQNGPATAAAPAPSAAAVAPETRRITESIGAEQRPAISGEAWAAHEEDDADRGAGKPWLPAAVALALALAGVAAIIWYRRRAARKPSWRNPERWRMAVSESGDALREAVAETPSRVRGVVGEAPSRVRDVAGRSPDLLRRAVPGR